MTLLDQPVSPTRNTDAANPHAVLVEAENENDAANEAEAESAQALPAFGPLLGWSIAIASILMFLGTGIPMAARTGSAWDGIGLGAFCAFWGGPGFGTMAAGAIWTLRCERAERRSAPSPR